jgi:hypothetical protein
MGLFGVAGDACNAAPKTKAHGVECGSFGVIVEIVIARATALGLIISLWVFGEG